MILQEILKLENHNKNKTNKFFKMKKTAIMLGFAFVITFTAKSQNDCKLQLTLRDGSSLSGTTKFSSVSLATDFGKLEIPAKNITSVDVGISSNKTTDDKVNTLIKQLANSNESLRESAYQELVKMDVKAIPAINKVINSANYEAPEYSDFTADMALSELMSNYNVDNSFSEKDVITIDNDYRMAGTYEFTKIELKTDYGSLTIPKEKIQHFDVIYTGDAQSSDLGFKLMATKHISSNTNGGWLKTGIMVKNGQKLSITATGEITFASLSNAKYKPDGKTVGSSSAGYDGGDYGYEGGGTYPQYGNVVFKIGESGTTMKAGAKFNGTAQSTGMLYISIYETVYNAANTGSYNVKITVH